MIVIFDFLRISRHGHSEDGVTVVPCVDISSRAMSRQCVFGVFSLLILTANTFAEELRSTDGIVRAIKVLPDKAPDCTSLKSIVDSVTRGCKTNDEKAIAIYNFMRLTHYHRAYPSEPGGIPVLKEINCYGWSLCGGLHAEQSALWRELGWNWRFVGWPGHTTVEAYYDGRWHYLDVFLKFYAWMPDPNNPAGRTIAGEDDLASNPQELLLDAFVADPARKVMYQKGNEFALFGDKANWQAPAFLVCGDDLPGMIQALREKNRVGPEPGWGGMQHATGSYSADVNLAPGFALTNTWDKADGAWYWAGSQTAPCHTCGDKEIRNSPEKGPVAEPYLNADWNCESYANGQLTFRPDLSDANCLKSFASIENVSVKDGALVPTESTRPARVTVLLKSPYILTQATGTADVVEHCDVSIDGGKTWIEVDLRDFGKAVGGHVEALVRISFRKPLKEISLTATVQNNPFALPFLSPGKNTIAVSVADPAALGTNKLVVTYAFRQGARRKTYEDLYLEGKEIARGHDASWEEVPTVVQKVFTAADLPATFDIDLGTPGDKYPVFPRMLFVRREVVSAKQAPLPLPDHSQPLVRRAGDELKTLPNPLLTGIQSPPPKVVRPTKTVAVMLTAGPVVTQSGKPATGNLLRWPKSKQEQVDPVAQLIDGELKSLPSLKALASAKLVIPIARAHEKAPTKIGVTELTARDAASQSSNFTRLGNIIATATVPQHPDADADWSPAKTIQLDVTKYVRSLIAEKATFHGFGLRVVPDRGVDDGWTVRIRLPEQAKIRLEIETYVDVDTK